MDRAEKLMRVDEHTAEEAVGSDIAGYAAARKKAIEWLGDRYLLASPQARLYAANQGRHQPSYRP